MGERRRQKRDSFLTANLMLLTAACLGGRALCAILLYFEESQSFLHMTLPGGLVSEPHSPPHNTKTLVKMWFLTNKQEQNKNQSILGRIF